MNVEPFTASRQYTTDLHYGEYEPIGYDLYSLTRFITHSSLLYTLESDTKGNDRQKQTIV